MDQITRWKVQFNYPVEVTTFGDTNRTFLTGFGTVTTEEEE